MVSDYYTTLLCFGIIYYMKNLLIIGARGFGREVCSALMLYKNDFTIKGFLDDKANALDAFEGYPPIVSSVESYEIQENDIFFCALGDPFYREKYSKIILDKGGDFLNMINPTAIVHPNAKIGKGVLISQYCSISSNTEIGDFSIIQAYSNIGHDAKIGKYCEIESYTFLGGGASVGDNCTLHTRSTILPGIKVKDNATIGAGSVVIRNVQSGTTVFGVPAKRVEF